MMANYYGLVTEVDEWVGRILAKVDSLDLRDNTLVVFTSDHGEMLGSHGMRSKNVFYEESAHVPLLMRMPGKIPAGVVVEQPVTTIDLHATNLDYLGAKGNYPTDGKSLRRYIENTNADNEYIVTEWPKTPSFMIRMGDWKLMMSNTAASTTLDMLFNLGSDSHEMNNLLGQNGMTASNAVIGKAEYLKALLVEYLTAMNHPALSEVKKRIKWKTVDLWVSDTMLDYGTVSRGQIKVKELYLGRTIAGSVAISNIAIEGAGAANYILDWTQGTIASGAHQVVKITYTDPGTGNAAANARVVITHNASRAARTVTLVSPNVIATSVRERTMASRHDDDVHVVFTHNCLSVTGAGNDPWKATVYSLSGQVLQLFNGQGNSRVSYRLAPGMYLVKMECRGVVRTDRLPVSN
jgi:hypothetical protein